jgi:hypothetical protein
MSVANAAPASAQGSASLECAGVTERPAITKTDALEAWAKEEAGTGSTPSHEKAIESMSTGSTACRKGMRASASAKPTCLARDTTERHASHLGGDNYMGT